ncbi:MAG: gamma-glutamyl-gamma-aminobutyrate hydrolase family protein [Gemmatimonadota bacterium]|nr:gamma-glutamyl-gamma-aminobutyrate hydrolase family protein [Gemmatimonadota bacterium]
MSPARKVGPSRIVAVTATSREDEGSRRVRLSASYIDALESAGLIPLVVPPLASAEGASAILGAVEGLVLTGGEDVNPSRYGTDPHPLLKTVSDRRDETEIALIREAKRRRIPVLAICRGIQVLNVALGGTLIQDIRAQVEGSLDHDDGSPRTSRSHAISIVPGSRTANALGVTQASVNSLHHQSVRDVSPELVVTATSTDGIVEAVETKDPSWWVLAVQWHPEEMTESPEPWDRGLFHAFAERLSSGK